MLYPALPEYPAFPVLIGMPEPGWGAYLYVLEGGPVEVNGIYVPTLGAAKITDESELEVEAKKDAELLLVDVLLI